MWKNVTQLPVEDLDLLQQAGLLWYRFVSEVGAAEEGNPVNKYRRENGLPSEYLHTHYISTHGVVSCGVAAASTYYRWYIREE